MLGKITSKSKNRKTGPIPVTSRAQSTCPTSCPFFNNGCYGENRGANPRTLFEIARNSETALTVDGLERAMRKRGNPTRFNGRALRRVLPIVRDREVGDVLDPATGEIDHTWLRGVAGAARRVGMTVFGYTHVRNVWRSDVPDGYVMNASCETPDDVADAWDRGLPAVVVGDRDQWSAMMPGTRFVSCPAESIDVTCAECGLCAKQSRMDDPESAPVIVFRPHGQRLAKVWDAIGQHRVPAKV